VKKLRFEEGTGLTAHWQATLTIYEATLRLLHPFMPFLTEELWQRLIHGGEANKPLPVSVSLAHFPSEVLGDIHFESVRLFQTFQEVIKAARELRADNKIDPKLIVEADVFFRQAIFTEADLAIIGSIAKLKLAQHAGTLTQRIGLFRETADFDLRLNVQAPAAEDGLLTPEARARIEKEVEKLRLNIASCERQLADPVFVSKAPEKVVNSIRLKLAEYQNQLAKNEKLLFSDAPAQ
jgi:valyl-tRNA synthetase